MIKYFKDLTTCCIFFPPPAPEKYLADTVQLQYTPHGKIPYTVVVASSPKEEEGGVVSLKKNVVVRVLYCHGNGDSLYYIQGRMKEIADGLAFSLSHEYRVEVIVLAWTYPTFPGNITTSSSQITAKTLQECAEIAWEELNSVPTTFFKAEDEMVELVEVAMGYSVGSYCASYLSTLAVHSPDIVFLLSPFATLPAGNNGKYNMTQKYLTGPLLDNVELLQRNKRSRVFAVFAAEDSILPFDHNSEITLHGKVEFGFVPGDHEVLCSPNGIRLAIGQLVDIIWDLVEHPLIPNSNVVVLEQLPPLLEEEEGGRHRLL